MSDKLVFDLASEVEGSPNVFIRKDWINILDNQNQNYNNNQSVLDTSQLSNSNKYMSYREAYLSIPLLMTVVSTPLIAGAGNDPHGWRPASSLESSDYAFGLKNWFGSLIHSFTLDYNGTTIIQQTPFINIWNSFKLSTSLSYADVETQGATIGFFPDSSTAWVYVPPVTVAGTDVLGLIGACGQGVCNNGFSAISGITDITQEFAHFDSGMSNNGFKRRVSSICYDPAGAYNGAVNVGGVPVNTYSVLQSTDACSALWKSYIFNKVSAAAGQSGILQYSVTATVYLKHVHSFFNMTPLLKGVFMKMTMNLNNTTTKITTGFTNDAAAAGAPLPYMICTSVQNAVGGVNPIMVSSAAITSVSSIPIAGPISNPPIYTQSPLVFPSAGYNLIPYTYAAGATTATQANNRSFTINLSVGSRCLAQTGAVGPIVPIEGPASKSIYLYIPAYTFNPVFEQSYLSSPIKQIKYTDVYQYQVLNVTGGNQSFNNLLTNGIANIKSVLIVPFYSNSGTSVQTQYGANPGPLASANSGFLSGVPVFQSPFDTAGCGTTSPLVAFTNMNVQISGQNAIYNVQKYSFEEWNNQLYGQNSVNGGMTDGLTSGLIDRLAFDMNSCFYYVNVERMLPVEQSVPKSVQILGNNPGAKSVDLYCFIEYAIDISIDALTGARV